MAVSLSFSAMHSSQSLQSDLQNVNCIILLPFLKSSKGFPFQILTGLISYQSDSLTKVLPKLVPSQVMCICMFLCLECSSTRSSYAFFLLAAHASHVFSMDHLYPLSHSYLFKQTCWSVPELHWGILSNAFLILWW